MLDAIHRYSRAQHVAEHIEFGAAETLAGRGGGADRAMVFQQQKTLGIGAPFGHVSFARTDLHQARDAVAQRRGTRKRAGVGQSGLLPTHANEVLQCCLAECRANRIDEAHGELGMSIGKAIVRGGSQVPITRRPADALLFGHGPHQPIVRQLHQLLPCRLGRCSEHRRDVRRTQRAAPLDQAEDSVATGIIQAHACILRGGLALRKHQLGQLRGYFAFGCHNPSVAPVGSVMMESEPAPVTSITSRTTVAPSDFALAVAATMSSTRT